jgi:hypothetical protein
MKGKVDRKMSRRSRGVDAGANEEALQVLGAKLTVCSHLCGSNAL